MTSASEVARILLQDIGKFSHAIRYANKVAAMRGEDSDTYAEAENILKQQRRDWRERLHTRGGRYA